jgi:hypothetical protein
LKLISAGIVNEQQVVNKDAGIRVFHLPLDRFKDLPIQLVLMLYIYLFRLTPASWW